MRTIKRVAVLGAGTMGSRIAAHFANAGVPSLLLDVVWPNEPNRKAAAMRGIETAAKQKPVAFFVESAASLVTPGNFEDHLPDIAACDWVIEAVTENLEIKRALWKKVEPRRNPDAILSTNTSGLPLARIAGDFSPEFRARFLGTHFFNPPRYLHLVEVIPTEATDPEVVSFVTNFCDVRLGKGVVLCKDTPNFIANRIGSFFGGTICEIVQQDDYTVEETDLLTGPLIGMPNSATFRLMDIVGLDVWSFVGRNLHDLVPHDRWRGRFLNPPFLDRLLERGWLGEKSGQGFYRRVGKGEQRVIEAVDLNTLEYHPAKKAQFPSTEEARNLEDLPARLRKLVSASDKAGNFLWKLFRDVCIYAAECVPEISDRIVEIDRAMRWGYAHPFGPFELWDALGVRDTAARIEAEGRELPANVARMLSSGADSFYRHQAVDRTASTLYFDFPSKNYVAVERRPGVLSLRDSKRAGRTVSTNPGASLVDLDDGVLCLEFHSKMNTIGEDTFRMMFAALEELERNWGALVIANQGTDFSVGANLVLVLLSAQEGEWDELSSAIHRFQQANLAMKCATKPVVAAPFGRTLGGGCEIAMHAARAQASAELYMGLVEVGVGLIPAGGGCKEMLLRLGDANAAFEQIGYARVSTSAEDARRMRFLTPADGITMNPERLVADAKAVALALAPGYRPVKPATDIPVSGETGFAAMKLGAWMARQGGYVSDYDMVIAEKLAYVLSGGRLTGDQKVSEQYLLDLEREAFLSLCGQSKSQERMQHMLRTGKALRN
jgi:3-hydroxyacyl-CoA dehydrogenase